jgi:ABC-type nickel/cobalt efflux system permease component RcnA
MSAISIITSLGLGALHALEPGHGKTFLASYSLAKRMSKKEVIKIISSMAISHSLLLLILGLFIPLVLPRQEETIHIYVQILASAIVLFVGFKMLYTLYKKEHDDKSCSCGYDHTQEQHNESLLLIKKNETIRNKVFTSINQTNFNLTTPEKNKKNSSPVLVGIVNGIMPCPSALAVVGIAFTYTSVWSISFIMLAYVLGFIAAMFCLLTIFVIFKNKFINSNPKNFKSHQKVQLVSAIVIILSGFYYLFLAYNHSH